MKYQFYEVTKISRWCLVLCLLAGRFVSVVTTFSKGKKTRSLIKLTPVIIPVGKVKTVAWNEQNDLSFWSRIVAI